MAPGGFTEVFSPHAGVGGAKSLETLVRYRMDGRRPEPGRPVADLHAPAHGARDGGPAPRRRRRSSIASARRSNAGSTIPISRRRGWRRPKEYPSAIFRSCSKAREATSRIICASAGCSGPGPTCRTRPRRIIRSRKSPIAAASMIPRISAGRFATGSDCRRASFASRKSNAPPASSSAAGQRGWPQEALAQLRSHHPLASAARSAEPAEADEVSSSAEGDRSHHHLSVEAARVHWGYFSRSLKPQIEINSGDTITIETLTQHASDDPERMIAGDAGAESVFRWTRDAKNVDRRGAGPMDASIYGRGAGEGFGVHICTGPVAVKDAQPGDVLEVRILDIVPRPSRNPDFEGRVFGSSVAAWWGYHYNEFLAEPKPREVVTIYEIFAQRRDAARARALFLSLGAADRSVRRRARDLRLSRRAGRPRLGQATARRARRHPHSAAAAFRRDRGCAARGGFRRTRFRRPISAAISTTGGSARDRRSICRYRCRARCCRSAIHMRRRATANWAAPRSNVR